MGVDIGDIQNEVRGCSIQVLGVAEGVRQQLLNKSKGRSRVRSTFDTFLYLTGNTPFGALD